MNRCFPVCSTCGSTLLGKFVQIAGNVGRDKWIQKEKHTLLSTPLHQIELLLLQRNTVAVLLRIMREGYSARCVIDCKRSQWSTRFSKKHTIVIYSYKVYTVWQSFGVPSFYCAWNEIQYVTSKRVSRSQIATCSLSLFFIKERGECRNYISSFLPNNSRKLGDTKMSLYAVICRTDVTRLNMRFFVGSGGTRRLINVTPYYFRETDGRAANNNLNLCARTFIYR